MADLGEITIIDLPDILAVGDVSTGELTNEYPSVTILDADDVLQIMDPTGYYIAGTISFYTGPPVPREGQIWPRGNNDQ